MTRYEVRKIGQYRGKNLYWIIDSKNAKPLIRQDGFAIEYTSRKAAEGRAKREEEKEQEVIADLVFRFDGYHVERCAMPTNPKLAVFLNHLPHGRVKARDLD